MYPHVTWLRGAREDAFGGRPGTYGQARLEKTGNVFSGLTFSNVFTRLRCGPLGQTAGPPSVLAALFAV